MRRFKNLAVVPITGRADPPPALEEAVELAQTSGARLTLLGHVDEVPDVQAQLLDGSELDDLNEKLRNALAERLTQWTEGLPTNDVRIEVASGSQPVVLAEQITRDGFDLVVLAADGTNESASTARRILRACTCSVWMLRPGFTGQQVLAAIDPDDDPGYNRLILELARSQAELHGGEVRVMHAWELFGLRLLDDAAIDSALRNQLNLLSATIEDAHREGFEKTLADAGIGAGTMTHMVDGPPARAIRGLTTLYRSDLIVMGAGVRSGSVLGLGSTAEQVLAETDASVLIVKRTHAPGRDSQ